MVDPVNVGRGSKKLTLVALAWILACYLLVVVVTPAFAADPPIPTNLQIDSVKVCRHLVEDDDFLAVLHYNIHYDSGQPSYPANRLFTFRLMDTDGTTHLAAITPYAYYNAGYDYGIAAFYFPAAEAPSWEEPYVVKVSGNPEYFASPPVTSRTLVPSDYSQMATQEENQVVLGNYIIDVVRKLELNWDITLLYSSDLGTVLNSTGELYLRGAITNLQAMAPQVFAVQVETPQYNEQPWTEAQGQAYQTRFEDTWIGDELSTAADELHIKWNVITGILVLVVIAGFAVWDQIQYGTVKPAMIEGTIVCIGATVMGWWAYAIMAIITIAFALFVGYVWMFRHG